MPLLKGYHLASLARTKLNKEASRSEHNLHRLVGHANLLDTLLEGLDNALSESESGLQSFDSKLSTVKELRKDTKIEIVIQSFEDERHDESSHIEDESDCTEIDDEVDITHVLVRWPTRHPTVDHVQAARSEDDLSIQRGTLSLGTVGTDMTVDIHDEMVIEADRERVGNPPRSEMLDLLELSLTELMYVTHMLAAFESLHKAVIVERANRRA